MQKDLVGRGPQESLERDVSEVRRLCGPSPHLHLSHCFSERACPRAQQHLHIPQYTNLYTPWPGESCCARGQARSGDSGEMHSIRLCQIFEVAVPQPV